METASYSGKRVFAAACAGMAVFGVVMLALGSIMEPLKARVPQAYSLPQYLSIGLLAGTLLFGPVVDKSGYKWMTIGAAVAALAGLLGLSGFTSMSLLVPSMLLLGLGGGILNGLTNALVSDISDDSTRSPRLSLLGAFYCIGALLWTVACALIKDYKIPLAAAAAVTLAFIIFFILTDFPKAKQQENVSYLDSLRLMGKPVLLLFALILFFESGFEGISCNYLQPYLVANGFPVSAATFCLTMYTVGMLAGRLALTWFASRTSDLRMLVTYLEVALAGCILMYYAKGNSFVPYLAITFIGFGCGATFPVVLSRLGAAFSAKTGSAVSAAMFIALSGQTAFNHFTGRIFSGGSISLYPSLMVVAVAMMVLLLPHVAVNAAWRRGGTAPPQQD